MEKRAVTPKAILRGHSSALSCAQYIPNTPGLLATGDANGDLHIWSTFIQESLLRLQPFDDASGGTYPLIAVVQDPLTSTLVLHSKGGNVSRLDLAHNPFAPDAAPGVRGLERLCKFSDSFCGLRMLSPGVLIGPEEDSASGIGLRDLRTRAASPEYAGGDAVGVAKDRGMLFCMDVMNTGNQGTARVVAGYENGSVALWEPRKLDAPIWAVSASSDVVTDVNASPHSESFAAVASAVDDVSMVWRGRVVATGRVREKGVSCLRWQRDGRVLATAGWDGRVRLWDGRRRKQSLLRPVASLKWHRGKVTALAFGQEVNYFASGGDDATIALWDLSAAFLKPS